MTEREVYSDTARVGVYVVASPQVWVAEVTRLRVRDGVIVWDDPQDPDEVIQAVYIVPHHGGIVLVVTDQNLYAVDAATFGACCEDDDSIKLLL